MFIQDDISVFLDYCSAGNTSARRFNILRVINIGSHREVRKERRTEAHFYIFETKKTCSADLLKVSILTVTYDPSSKGYRPMTSFVDNTLIRSPNISCLKCFVLYVQIP